LHSQQDILVKEGHAKRVPDLIQLPGVVQAQPTLRASRSP
jgi:hypothetical protein